jgi:hypothetical protein
MSISWKSAALGAVALLSLGSGAQSSGEGITIRASEHAYQRAGFYDDCRRRRYIRAPDADDCRPGRRGRNGHIWDGRWNHPIFAWLHWRDYYDDCRIVLTRRVSARGDLIVQRARICE